MTDRIGWAESKAKQDVTLIREQLFALDGQALYAAEEGRYLVCDGSMYAPSWRALSGGAAVWDAADEDDVDTIEIYVETLDRLTDELGDECEMPLWWEDGCLWIGTDVLREDYPQEGVSGA